MTGQTVYGYDGTAYGVDDRVEIHPGTDFWIRGARFGTVVRITPRDRVHVRLDRVSGTVAGTAETFRLVASCV